MRRGGWPCRREGDPLAEDRGSLWRGGKGGATRVGPCRYDWAMIGRRAILGAMGLAGAIFLSATGGCFATSEPGVLSHDPAQRRDAIVEAGAARDGLAVPDLIARLDSQDPGERLLAIRSLELITGETCGYDYAASVGERQRAILRWTDWVQAHDYAGAGARRGPGVGSGAGGDGGVGSEKGAVPRGQEGAR